MVFLFLLLSLTGVAVVESINASYFAALSLCCRLIVRLKWLSFKGPPLGGLGRPGILATLVNTTIGALLLLVIR